MRYLGQEIDPITTFGSQNNIKKDKNTLEEW